MQKTKTIKIRQMETKKEIFQSGFKFNWQNKVIESPSISDGFFEMREWQKQAFELLKDAPLMILNAPMGSGKSWLMCYLSAYKMKENPALRSIIAVPQTIIAHGFTNAKLKMPNGEKLYWSTNHNLCIQKRNRSSVKYFINWLETPYKSFEDKIILCTHTTIVKAYQKLKERNQLDLLKNLLLWIDEAHHIKNAAIKEIPDQFLSNEIGKLVSFFLECSTKNLQLGLTTASFFRGDRCNLLTPEMELRFNENRFNLPYDEYLASMRHLKSFSFDFLICGYDYTKAIEVIANFRPDHKTIYPLTTTGASAMIFTTLAI